MHRAGREINYLRVLRCASIPITPKRIQIPGVVKISTYCSTDCLFIRRCEIGKILGWPSNLLPTMTPLPIHNYIRFSPPIFLLHSQDQATAHKADAITVSYGNARPLDPSVPPECGSHGRPQNIAPRHHSDTKTRNMLATQGNTPYVYH